MTSHDKEYIQRETSMLMFQEIINFQLNMMRKKHINTKTIKIRKNIRDNTIKLEKINLECKIKDNLNTIKEN